MLRKWVPFLLMLVIVSQFAVPSVTAQNATPEAPESTAQAALHRLLEEAMATDPSLPGIALRVESPVFGVVETAVGEADLKTGTPLTPDLSFRIASITKTFTAATIFRLVETGDLELTDPISSLLSPEIVEALTLGGYDPTAITVHQLLTHTSGIYNYADDSGFQAFALMSRTTKWTRLEEVQWAMERGEPTGKPGEHYDYSDTGYILLGEIIERATGLDLGEAYRSLLNFEGIGLANTYLPSIDVVPANEPDEAHQYAGNIDVTDIDPTTSIYGNAGLISTLADISTFYRALFNGEVFEKLSTLDAMLAVSDVNESVGVASGIRLYSSTPIAWGHAGLWGSLVLYLPEQDVTIAFTYNQAYPETFSPGEFATAIIETLDELGVTPVASPVS